MMKLALFCCLGVAERISTSSAPTKVMVSTFFARLDESVRRPTILELLYSWLLLIPAWKVQIYDDTLLST